MDLTQQYGFLTPSPAMTKLALYYKKYCLVLFILYYLPNRVFRMIVLLVPDLMNHDEDVFIVRDFKNTYVSQSG